jgi:hypothetical protein
MGMGCSTATITCATCKKLRDAVVSEEPGMVPEPLPVPKCPGARTRVHEALIWTHPGPCPRCGATMDRGEVTTLWD